MGTCLVVPSRGLGWLNWSKVMAAFAECGVMPEIIRALDELGWQLPTPIQQDAVPLILGGGDVLGAAETGTGKTG